MRTALSVSGKYDRVSRNFLATGFSLSEGEDLNKACIFCGAPDSKQSVYYPPKKVSERVLVGEERGVVGYCCSKHYMRFRNMSSRSTLGLTFEEFYAKTEGFGERKTHATIPISDVPLPKFKMANDGEIWYLGLGHLQFIRVENPVYEAFKHFINSSTVQYVKADVRRAMFDEWRASNPVSDRELMAFEHFLKL